MSQSVAILNASRKLMDRALEHMTTEDLAWRAAPRAKSIGHMLLHIAAFRYLAALALDPSHAERYAALWNSLKGGFAVDAGFPEAEPLTLAQYRSLLEQVDELAQSVVGKAGDHTLVTDKGIDHAVSRLASLDKGTDGSLYDKLARVMRNSRAVHSANAAEIGTMLISHEAYHRGQIFFQKFLKSQS